ncbi:UDP-4-amino-4,6-dideoxy-N-acetyl-beta-L-altrosamine N-acetyltransferase [Marinobacter sp. ATCH36]|uniref:UDP-4-amino-4, 6-dideoxy-N-acetyl-beta-L-altrosamine N-acetyltransferase n=1 Tax=Marinobacter sp. ATCH36 TaxID=2945106 RepID=UPI0032E3B242
MVESYLRNMQASDLERVWQWRNHPEVRRFMFTTHEILWDEHLSWFRQAQASSSVKLLIYEIENVAVGFASLKMVHSEGVADWGFYLDPNAPRGSGRGLGESVIRHGFQDLSLHKLCGQALAFNERSIAFHRSLGFREEGRLREQHFDGQRYHDVLCFGLLKADWLPNETVKNHENT